ncbi:MAG: hypothetical protein JWM10_4106, partial [Myxococcaceae bacterium]|nr:hypothetical protein [Myxococcaceae bacterium]
RRCLLPGGRGRGLRTSVLAPRRIGLPTLPSLPVPASIICSISAPAGATGAQRGVDGRTLRPVSADSYRAARSADRLIGALAASLFAQLPRCGPPSPSRIPPEYRVVDVRDAGARDASTSPGDGGRAPTRDAGRRVRWGDCTERLDLPPSRCEVRCSFGDCNAHGWTVTYGNGVRGSASCSFGDCNANGWSTRYSDGVTVEVRCSFGSCDQHGWTTSSRLGTGSARCSFDECSTQGYSLSLPGGGSGGVRCNFGDCRARGFEVSAPGGGLSCRCSFGDCNANGLSCD